jgi:hypothetical protein
MVKCCVFFEVRTGFLNDLDEFQKGARPASRNQRPSAKITHSPKA